MYILRLHIHIGPRQVKHAFTDEGSVTVASTQHILKTPWISHILLGSGDIMKDHPCFGGLIGHFDHHNSPISAGGLCLGILMLVSGCE